MELQDKGQDGAYCLLRCKSAMYIPHWRKVSQFFFLWFMGRAVWFDLLYLDVMTSTVDR